MRTDGWTPKGPLVLESGRYAGKALEQVMFLNPRWVRVLFENTCRPEIRRHAEWLLRAGDSRRARICPRCGFFMADYLICHRALDGDFIITGIACRPCVTEEEQCQQVRLLPLALSSAISPRLSRDRQRIAQYLKKVWRLERLTAQKAFAFFSAPGREDDELTLPP